MNIEAESVVIQADMVEPVRQWFLALVDQTGLFIIDDKLLSGQAQLPNAGIQLKQLFTGCRVKPRMTKCLVT